MIGARRRVAIAAILLAACGGEQESSVWPPFTVRGAFAEPPHLRIAIDEANAPLDSAVFAAAIARASAQWNALGSVHFELVTGAEAGPADVTIAWKRGHHGACEPFGPSTAVAHSGPVARPTFVHFDAARSWDADRVYRTALHELGHVLGLGHSLDPASAMSNGSVPDRLGAADRDGIASLYGGGTDGDGDLILVAADGSVRTILRGLAPANTAHAAFDCDGDGTDELVLWRTDAASDGALIACAFGPGPRLVAVRGPFLGITIAGMDVRLVRTDAGERLLLGLLPGGRIAAVRFGDHGVPESHDGDPAALHALVNQLRGDTDRGDFDGDGTIEHVVAAHR